MFYAYRSAGKLGKEGKKTIDNVVEKCAICKKNVRSRSRPSVAVPRATEFNTMVAVDLKVIGDKNILWMICGFTKFIRGIFLKDKTPESVIKGLHGAWCLDIGFPTVGFWADNGGEFKNHKLEEFVNKMGIKIEFTPAFSPWSNRVNERNHYSCDVIVKKVME